MTIINSILDTDFYKLTMMSAVLELFPNAQAVYKFKNRGSTEFNNVFIEALKTEIYDNMPKLFLTDDEYSWLKEKIRFFKPAYLEYLKNYRFDPEQVEFGLSDENDLWLTIKGPWHSTILYEVPLLAAISELYFELIDTEWKKTDYEKEQYQKAREKADKLHKNKCYYADFGTRRRRSFEIQKRVISAFYDYNLPLEKKTFVGTSNVYFAKLWDTKAIGTCAHEWTQAMQALESLNHCNYYAMQNWIKIFNTDLGIALSDSTTTKMFFKNFNRRLAMLYDGIRQDSGDPFEFTDNTITHYKKLNINPMSKFIIFSDSLDVEKAIQIKQYCEGKINCSFGIGTHFSNDFKNSPALNMVIKIYSIDDFPVVKLSDSDGKEMGDPKAIEIMKWIIKNQLVK